MKQEYNKKYIDRLANFGLKPQEAVVYLSCLKLGEASVGQIAKDCGIQRTFVYDVVDDLAGKGVLSLVETEGVKIYSAISIEQFKRVQTEKIKEFEEIMPELRALENSGEGSPKVRFYRGAEGIKTALHDTLSLPRGSEILAFATAKGFWEDEERFAEEYIQERVKKDINYRSIMPDTAEIEKYIKQDKEHKRETRLVPADFFGFTNEINIYGNKMLIISLQKELLAVIIESESVAKTQRMIFELAWLGVQKFIK